MGETQNKKLNDKVLIPDINILYMIGYWKDQKLWYGAWEEAQSGKASALKSLA